MKDIIVKLVNSKGGRKEYNVSTEVHSSDDTSEARPGWWTDVEENNGGNESKLRGSLVYILTAEQSAALAIRSQAPALCL